MSNPVDGRFRDVEAQYAALKAQLSAGQMTREQFEAALQAQMILDAQGRYWMIGAESGRWYVHDGQNWVQQDPPSMTPPAATPPAPPAPTPDEHRAARQDSITLASFIPPQIPPKAQSGDAPLRSDQAQTLVGFTPPVIPPKTQQPAAARPDAQTMVGFTPPPMPSQSNQTPPPAKPPQTGPAAATAATPPPAPGTPRKGGLPPVLIMAIIFLFVCVAGVALLGWAISSRFAPDQAPTPTSAATAIVAAATTAPTTAPTAVPATATSVPPTSAPTSAPVATIVPVIPTVSIVRPTATPAPPATATFTAAPATATATTAPPTATATNTPLPPPTRTPTPQFGLGIRPQGYADWGRPDINNPATYCTTFNNGFRWRQFVWNVDVTNRSAAMLTASEWTSQAFTDQGTETRVCVSNLPNTPPGETRVTTFVAYVEQGRFIQRIVHTVRGAATQKCLDSSWKETGC